MTLATFGAYGSLIQDAAGDLFGTTFQGGTYNDGTVFEIAKTGATYGAPVTLATFNGDNGVYPNGSLITDAAGDLFGTTGGSNGGYGTVFEIANTASGYGALTTLVTFNGSNGANPYAGLISDAAGDLFGTTLFGGGHGTVFEIAKTDSGYGSPVTLATFDGNNGDSPAATLSLDAAGDLFGTTFQGGTYNDGTVFEIAKTVSGYGALTKLVTFNGQGNGAAPYSDLVIDAAGDLFGTTAGDGSGTNGDGTVFEITVSGHLASVAADFNGDGTSDVLWINPSNDIAGFWVMNNGRPTWQVVGQGSSTMNIEGYGDFTGNGTSDILWENLSNGIVGDWLMSNNVPTWQQIGQGSTTMSIVGVGDFYGTGTDDVLWQNPTNNYVGFWQMQNNTPTWEAIGYGSTTMNIAGVGDFTGNGQDDILWENPSNGVVGMWAISGSTPTWSQIGQGSTSMNIVGAGDFIGNGTDDILWENPTNGTVGFWGMTNGQATSWNVVATANTAYQVAGIGDYYGSGIDDILWRNPSTGNNIIWQMDNGQATGHDLGIASTTVNPVKA